MCSICGREPEREFQKSDTPNENKDKFCESQYVAAGIHELHICVCTGTSKREYRKHMFLTVTAL